MKACSHCGRSMPDAAARCLSCGVAVEGDVVGEVFRTVDRPMGSSVSLVAVLIFSVLLLTAAVVYLYF